MRSNRGMNTVPVEQRLEALEIKASYTEDLLDELNLAVFRQQQLIDRLVQEVQQLRQQMPERGSGSGQTHPGDERPPHY